MFDDSFVFFGELGTEPLAYVGDRTRIYSGLKGQIHKLYTSEIEANVRGELISGDVIHTLSSTNTVATIQVQIENAVHKVVSTELSGKALFVIVDSIHRHLVGYKFNAPVRFKCGRFLETPAENRYLETPTTNC